MAQVSLLFYAIVLTIFMAIIPVASDQHSLPRLYFRGNHYQLGFETGRTFSQRIRSAFKESRSLHQTLLPFYKTAQGYVLFKKYLQSANETFPHYVREIKGIADGSRIAFDQVFLMHIENEIETYLKKFKNMTPSCTDIHVKTNNHTLLGHNEDADSAVRRYGYIITAEIVLSNDTIKEKFTAYTYPGLISGNAFGFNNHGFLFTCNAVFPRQTNQSALPRNILTRAILASRGIDDALQLVKNTSVAVGVSINMGDLSTGKLVNIELSPYHGNKMILVDKHYYHFNMYQNFNPPQYDDPSSIHRRARAKMLPLPPGKSGILLILGDTKDPKYPIYRDATPPDHDLTVATGYYY
ncbi:uncharacterized protein TRIADDRAFT_52543 [Trichoplax adhaerens]|uniref:Peptidase C45 hydrolase domain-containing protein n=1 Tax=Trichoplax adhaerens TaxID=10228 RepID=B3RJ24_TRIAD|nr:hypothetical protein TRIADDRAFT_52543 [Trichoplax adhaerens]EDV29046.1 hypothetical protein TRIADDRAFT_52543 [Trichoplax adhaerens]|eukprot:XP_002108248.1 hypothetical protein TRIADDRAFT_52543 [Trichoplax adhaerens]